MYRPGLYACLATAVANLVIVVILTVHAYLENKKADRGEKELEADDVSGIFWGEVDMTDNIAGELPTWIPVYLLIVGEIGWAVLMIPEAWPCCSSVLDEGVNNDCLYEPETLDLDCCASEHV